MSDTVADFILQRLHAWGVRRIFGFPGDGIGADILDQFGRPHVDSQHAAAS